MEKKYENNLTPHMPHVLTFPMPIFAPLVQYTPFLVQFERHSSKAAQFAD